MATAEAARLYRRTARKVVIIAILGAVLGIVALRNAGYGVWIGGGTTGETRNDLVLLNCRYFTGSEQIINRMWKPADAAKTGCPLLARFAGAPMTGGDLVGPLTP